MKRLQPIDRLDRLSLYVPREEPQHDLVFREVGEDKAMLLDRLDLLLEIENRRGCGRCAANAYLRPTARPRPDRSRQGDVDGIAFEIERAAAKHGAERNRMHVTAEDARDAPFHSRDRAEVEIANGEKDICLDPTQTPTAFDRQPADCEIPVIVLIIRVYAATVT
jgi:hypothetical protein